MSDKVIIEELCCRECPEKEVKRCLEQKVKYQNSINYILSFIENDDNKEHIAELKKRITYPTRCDVVLEKQLQRMKKEYEFLYNEYNRYSSICTELNYQISDLTKVLISLFRLLVCDYDKFKGQILSKTDIDYIEKRKQSINKCLKVFNEVLEDVH